MGKRYYLGEAGVRKLRTLLNGRGESGSVHGTGPDLALEDEFAHPFTVQWAASAGESGAWLIWLPTSDLVMFGSDAIDVTEDLEEAGGEYPSGWYVLPSGVLSSSNGGDLYLKVTHIPGEDEDDDPTLSAEFVSSATSEEDVTCVPICHAAVDSVSGYRSVKQYVTSAVLLGAGEGEDAKQYDCDERSISRISGGESITGIPVYGDYFHLMGFGKFTPNGMIAPIGTFDEATDLELDGDSEESTSVAFLVRTGNTNQPDSNFLGYRKLKIGKSSCSSPFAYEKSTSTDSSTHQPVTTHKLVNCKFYWEGELKSLPDFDVSGILSGGTVYLTGTQPAPSAQSKDPAWTWAVATAQAQAPSGGKVLNYKLYDFAQSKPSVDYRTTFLSLEDTTQKARYVFKKPDGTASVEVDTTGSSPKIVITNGSGKTITLDTGDIPSDCAGALGIHSFSYKDANGDTQTFHGLFCSDIDLDDAVPGDGDLKEFVWNDQPIAEFHGTDDIDIGTKQIVGSGHIVVTENAGQIVISDTLEDGSDDPVAGPGITVVDKTVSVNPDNASVETANGQENSQKKVQLYGFNAISSHTTQYSVGQALIDQVASGEFLLVAANVGGVLKLAYKPLDPIPLSAATGSGLAIVREGSAGSKTMKVDLSGRGSTSFGINDVYRNGSATGVKVFSSGRVDISTGIDVAAGRGISISTSGNTKTINAHVASVQSQSPKLTVETDQNGVVKIGLVESEEESSSSSGEPATSGFTGTREVVRTVWYDLSSHQLKRTSNQWTFNNGLLVGVGEDVTTVIETAVAETIA